MEDPKLEVKSRQAQMYALIEEQQKSGISVKSFCNLKNIKHPVFYYWIKKYSGKTFKSKTKQKVFSLIQLSPNILPPVQDPIFAEYKGIRFFQEPSAALLKALIS